MNTSYRLICVLPVLAFAFAIAGEAHGDIVMSLNDLGSPGIEVIIADNAPAGTPTSIGLTTHGDTDAAVGQVGVPVGLTAGVFNIDPITTAFGFGGGPDAFVDLLLVAEATVPGTLVASVTATNLTTDDPPSGIVGNIGGFASPDVDPTAITYVAGLDPGNGYFVFPPGSTVGPVSIGGGGFGTTLTSPVSGSNPFSLSETITITANSPGQEIGFDAQLNGLVPEPSSLLLWAVASGMTVWIGRRKHVQTNRRSEKGEG